MLRNDGKNTSRADKRIPLAGSPSPLQHSIHTGTTLIIKIGINFLTKLNIYPPKDLLRYTLPKENQPTQNLGLVICVTAYHLTLLINSTQPCSQPSIQSDWVVL